MNNKVILTGATGYIGSHMYLELLANGFEVLGIDDFSNSSEIVLSRIEQICHQKLNFLRFDIRDTPSLTDIFRDFKADSVLHFAGVKSVRESVHNPHKYYDINVAGTISVLRAMVTNDVKKIVFSSSCTVYGQPSVTPVDESTAVNPLNPYGRSKAMAENIIADIVNAESEYSAILLRYFNPIGAHPSRLIGEEPSDVPDNLLPYIVEVASGVRTELSVYGDDYDTADGTCIRDYIHIMDLVSGHLNALVRLDDMSGVETINLGTGKGYSVLQVVNTFERATGVAIPYVIQSRRTGDAATMFADPSKAEKLLNWKASKSLLQMCEDHWHWGQHLLQSNQRK